MAQMTHVEAKFRGLVICLAFVTTGWVGITWASRPGPIPHPPKGCFYYPLPLDTAARHDKIREMYKTLPENRTSESAS